MSVSGTDMTLDIAIKADSPIRAKEEDLLGRDRMATSVAEMINRSFGHKDVGDESLVAGIEGEWGSGKTSFINLVLENLKSLRQRDYLIIEFNPWNFSDQNELITDFFKSIIVGLESDKTLKGNTFETARKIRRYFPKLLERSNVNLGIPGVLSVGLDLEGMTGDPLERQKKEINGLLAKIGKPIVIVIDDIDRLDARETRLVFKLVRMTANFANTVFLLAYDRDKVGKRITEKGIEGEEFLKKIVQLSFPLPRADQQDLFRILFMELGKTMQSFDSKSWGWERWEDFFGPDLEEDDFRPNDLRERWEDLFETCLKKLFPTIRDIRRYINGLRLDLEIIGKEEVNPVDFLGIEAIRIFAPDVYFAMANEKSVFAFPAADKLYGRHRIDPLPSSEMVQRPVAPDEKTRKETCERIIKEKSPSGLADTIREIVRKLFPQVEKLYPSKETYDGPRTDDWGRLLRVCSGYVFDGYFSLSKDSLTLSEERLDDFLATVGDRSAVAQRLEGFRKKHELRILLTRLLDRLNDLNDGKMAELLVSVFDFTEGIIGAGLEILDPYSVESQTQRLGRQALKKVPKERRFEFLTRILNSTENVYRSVCLVGEINEEVRRHEERRLLNEPLLSREEASRLKEICVEKIRKAAKDGSLANNAKLAHVLSRWEEWESSAAVKDYVAELLETDAGMFSFLKAHFYFSGDRKSIHKGWIGKFANITELDRRVDSLDEDGLDEEKAAIVRLYRNFQ